MTEEETYLHSLKIGHYVLGGIIALFALIPLVHVGMGIALATGNFPSEPEANEAFPAFFGWIFVVFGLVAILLGQAIAILTIVSGRFIRDRKNYLFVFIVSCVLCALFPFGTVLGVFTIILLSKPEIKALFQTPPPIPKETEVGRRDD